MEDPVKPVSSAAAVPKALDGGYGWVVVAGAFVAYFIADGWSYSFGIIYPELLDHFHESKGKTAIIGALLYGMPLLISPVICALTTVYGCRKVAIAGGFITGLSFIWSAFAKSVDILCLSTGIFASVGLSMTYIPALVIVTYYFEKRRGIATGLAVTGSGLGAFAFPPLLEFLLQTYNWRWTLMILGAVCFNIAVAGSLFRPPPMRTPSSEDLCIIEDFQDDNTRKYLKVKSGNILLPRLHVEEGNVRNRTQSLTNISKEPEANTSLSVSVICGRSSLRERSPNFEKQLLSVPSTSSPELYGTCPSEPPQVTEQDHPEPEQAHPNSKLSQIWTETKTVTLSMFDKTLLKDFHYLIFCASGFILYLWVGVPYVYLIDKSMLLGIDGGDAAFLLSIIGISRTVGQLILGFLGDLPQISTTGLYGFSVVVSGLATLFVPLYTTYTWLSVYTTLFGFFVSVTYCLQMMAVVDMVGLQRSTNAFGLMQLIQGISTMLGTPVAGWLYDATGDYNPSFYTAGGFMVLSGLMLIPIPSMIRSRQHAQQQTDIDDNYA